MPAGEGEDQSRRYCDAKEPIAARRLTVELRNREHCCDRKMKEIERVAVLAENSQWSALSHACARLDVIPEGSSRVLRR